eukprot:CAMPEP_0172709846 /NCGR_PEP_ID=MMETSP1074-20121228/55306_1 /TAXON_ID=2916 /ORGANISM="Ceratium fusus, Strain PA161109" /LENGTH=295 /DNA_ID=CAMNT_0013533161 /DNA_START=24 /DNA_END=912 /DNA_ORIENTATION=+
MTQTSLAQSLLRTPICENDGVTGQVHAARMNHQLAGRPAYSDLHSVTVRPPAPVRHFHGQLSAEGLQMPDDQIGAMHTWNDFAAMGIRREDGQHPRLITVRLLHGQLARMLVPASHVLRWVAIKFRLGFTCVSVVCNWTLGPYSRFDKDHWRPPSKRPSLSLPVPMAQITQPATHGSHVLHALRQLPNAQLLAEGITEGAAVVPKDAILSAYPLVRHSIKHRLHSAVAQLGSAHAACVPNSNVCGTWQAGNCKLLIQLASSQTPFRTMDLNTYMEEAAAQLLQNHVCAPHDPTRA